MTHSIRSFIVGGVVLAVLVGAYACHKSKSPETRNRVATQTPAPIPAKTATRNTPATLPAAARHRPAWMSLLTKL